MVHKDGSLPVLAPTWTAPADTTARPARISPPSNRASPGVPACKLHQGVSVPAPVLGSAMPGDTMVPPVGTSLAHRRGMRDRRTDRPPGDALVPIPVSRCAEPADTTVPLAHTGHGNRGNLPLFAAPQPVPGLLRNPGWRSQPSTHAAGGARTAPRLRE